MRILHTADWHLGRSFHRVGIDETQRAALQQILDLIDQHSVDALIVAGDIYDRAIPSSAAVNNYNWMIDQLVDRGITTIMSSGNHDSADRLGIARSAIARAGIHLYTSVEQITKPVALAVDGAAAPLYVYAIPYLDPRAYATIMGADLTHQSVIDTATNRIRADLTERRAAEPKAQALCVAHLFAQGGTASDSEKAIQVGGVETVHASAFDGFSYTALGHLHRPQIVDSQEHIRYSGSLTKFSFSEVNNTNQVVILDYGVGPDGGPELTKIESHRLTAQLPMAVLEGSFAELTEPQLISRHGQDYLQITLVEDNPPTDAYRQLRQHYPKLLDYRRRRVTPLPEQAKNYQEQLAHVTTDEELCGLFYTHTTGREYGDNVAILFNSALENVRSDQE